MTEQRRTVLLDYRPPSSERGRAQTARALLWVALACWLVPLLGGLVCLGGFILTENDDFALVGFFLLPVGAVVALIGWVMVVVAWSLAPHGPPAERQCFRRRALLLFAAILLNFPVAWACASVGGRHLEAVEKRNGTWVDPAW